METTTNAIALIEEKGLRYSVRNTRYFPLSIGVVGYMTGTTVCATNTEDRIEELGESVEYKVTGSFGGGEDKDLSVFGDLSEAVAFAVAYVADTDEADRVARMEYLARKAS